MMWFTADLHLGDTNILHDMDRPFDSVEEMNRKVIDAINECVAVDDRLYILGDFTYRLPLAEAVRLRERIECQNVTLICGNHDGDWEDPDAPHRPSARRVHSTCTYSYSPKKPRIWSRLTGLYSLASRPTS